MTDTASTSSIIHLIEFVFGLFPMAISILVLCVKRPRGYGRLVGGLVLIGIAVLNVWLLSMFNETILPIFQKIESPLFSKMDLIEAKNSAAAWLYVLPAVAAAIGVNLISAFIIRDN